MPHVIELRRARAAFAIAALAASALVAGCTDPHRRVPVAVEHSAVPAAVIVRLHPVEVVGRRSQDVAATVPAAAGARAAPPAG